MSVQVNFYEIKPSPRKKRKISTPCENTYMNPALDLVSTEDPMWNNAMEIKVPNKKRKRSKSVDDITTFENCALDLGINKQALCALLSKELQNVKQNLNPIIEESVLEEDNEINNQNDKEPVYMNVIDLDNSKLSDVTSSVSDNSPLDYTRDFKIGITNLSFIDKLDLNSSISGNSLCLDDDLNESNIMEIKNIDAPKIPINMLKPTNPFLEDMIKENLLAQKKPEFVYNDESAENFQETQQPVQYADMVIPRRLFVNDSDTTISTVNEVSTNNDPHIYASIDELNNENQYETVKPIINKQSKILGYDVSKLSSLEILNLCNSGTLHIANLPIRNNTYNDSVDSNEGKKSDLKNQILKVGNKISKKMLSKIWKSKNKHDKTTFSTTLNPYEVPRKPEKVTTISNNTCFENPALNLGNSDSESDVEEPTYETIKTAKNTVYNMNVTPLAELNSNELLQNCSNISGKKHVRFDATLNKEKVITGNSFNSGDLNETELDMQIEQFHDELENCINEKKIIAMNL